MSGASINLRDRCQTCGKEFDLAKLDAKPRRLRLAARFGGDQQAELSVAADRGEDFDWLEGPCCYGPGYAVLGRSA